MPAISDPPRKITRARRVRVSIVSGVMLFRIFCLCLFAAALLGLVPTAPALGDLNFAVELTRSFGHYYVLPLVFASIALLALRKEAPGRYVSLAIFGLVLAGGYLARCAPYYLSHSEAHATGGRKVTILYANVHV